jgi:hypothetical protein
MSSVTSEELKYYTLNSRPFGHSYGEWTVKWWKWFLSAPELDMYQSYNSRTFSSEDQPYAGRVWFLAGKVGDEIKVYPTRSCRIPPSNSILFPVINCEVNSVEYPELKDTRSLIDHVAADEDKIRIKKCKIDGVAVPALRVKSDPTTFDVNFSKNNPFGVAEGLVTVAADGYWVFLKPLDMGTHSIEFEASCENGRLNSGAFYKLHVE